MATLSFLLMKASEIRAWKVSVQSGLCAFERWAREELHSARVMNMVALGYCLKTLGDISLEEVEMALKERFKGDLFKLNMAAVKIGLEASEF